MPYLASQVLKILRHPFLATINALINCINGMMRLFFDDMTLELNIINRKRQPSGFDDTEFPILNWMEDSILDDSFDDMFTAEYESFMMNDELECDVFEFYDLCSTDDCLLTTTFESAAESISPLALELKPLSNSLKYAFLGLDESLPIILLLI